MDEAMRAPDGRRIAASAAAEADGNRYFCPSCKSEVYLRRPADRAFHFYHSPLREPDCPERVNAESPWASLEAEAKLFATRDRWARELIRSIGGTERFRRSHDRASLHFLASAVLPHIYHMTRDKASSIPVTALNILELMTRPDFSLLALLFLQELIEALPDAGRYDPLRDVDLARAAIDAVARIDWHEALAASSATANLLPGLAEDLRPDHEPLLDGHVRIQSTPSGILLVDGRRIDRFMFRGELQVASGDGKIYALQAGRALDPTTLETRFIREDGDEKILASSSGAFLWRGDNTVTWSVLLCPDYFLESDRPIFGPSFLDAIPADPGKAKAKLAERCRKIAWRALHLDDERWQAIAPEKMSTHLLPSLYNALDALGLVEEPR